MATAGVSDHPSAPSSHAKNEVLDTYDMDESTRQAINRGTAEKLFPGLA